MIAAAAVLVVMLIGLHYFRSGGGGTVGRHIRYSDWLAWKDAVNECEQRLAELRKVEPKL